MGSSISKTRIRIPDSTLCFPSYKNEEELFESASRIEECHLQAVKIASWMASFMFPANYGTAGHLTFTAATFLFAFILSRASSPSTPSSDDKALDSGKCMKDCDENDNVTPSSSTLQKQSASKEKSLEDALIDSKVSTAIARKSVCELQAKISVIKNRVDRLLRKDISVEDKRLEVVPGIQTCEEVLRLFSDETHVFWQHPLVSAPFVVTFAGIFVYVAELSLALIPSYREHLLREMDLTIFTLEEYRKSCVQIRMEGLKFKRVQPGTMLEVVAANNLMSERNYTMEDSCLGPVSPIHTSTPNVRRTSDLDETPEDEADNVYHDANEAVSAYRIRLEERYAEFFDGAIRAAFNFSNNNSMDMFMDTTPTSPVAPPPRAPPPSPVTPAPSSEAESVEQLVAMANYEQQEICEGDSWESDSSSESETVIVD